MMPVENRKVGLYTASIVSLLALGIAAGGLVAELGRNVLHMSLQSSQTMQTIFVPIFASVLEMIGIHFWFRGQDNFT